VNSGKQLVGFMQWAVVLPRFFEVCTGLFCDSSSFYPAVLVQFGEQVNIHVSDLRSGWCF
jgi:hypothetical protein